MRVKEVEERCLHGAGDLKSSGGGNVKIEKESSIGENASSDTSTCTYACTHLVQVAHHDHAGGVVTRPHVHVHARTSCRLLIMTMLGRFCAWLGSKGVYSFGSISCSTPCHSRPG